MTAARDKTTGKRLDDPRWQQLAHAARRIYDELEDSDSVLTVSAAVESSGQHLIYTFIPRQGKLRRWVHTGADSSREDVENLLGKLLIDATPHTGGDLQ